LRSRSADRSGHLDRRSFPPTAVDASGERDYRDASGWEVAGAEHQLDGEWGSVFVTDAVIEVSWDVE
jgi:hypothetical protein